MFLGTNQGQKLNKKFILVYFGLFWTNKFR